MVTFSRYTPLFLLFGVVLFLTAIPAVDIYCVLGDEWRGVMPTFTDELNFARMNVIGEGYLTNGSGYYLEHVDGPPLVIFGGAWLNAIPLWFGMSFNSSLYLNFILWSLLFAATAYWLLRELNVPPWVAVAGVLLLYIESYEHIWRPVNLQPVYPFYFILYAAFLRILKEQNKRNTALLAVAVAASFYLFAYLWQIAAITFGLAFLYSLWKKRWALAKALCVGGGIGAVLGAPVPVYMLWLSHSSPYFWESMSRLGLTNTHLPTMEIVYSGGWVILTVIFTVFLLRLQVMPKNNEFRTLAFFIIASGLGLWIMQGSNLITGKWLETGEHVLVLLMPWLWFSSLALFVALWRRREEFSKGMCTVSVIVLALLSFANLKYTYHYFLPFVDPYPMRDLWRTEQLYAAPFAWLDEHEKEPVVVWSDPHDYLASVLPIFTRHFTLHTYFGMLELASDEEIQERYLVSQYFNNPTLADFRTDTEMNQYLGRHDYPHAAKTREREVKVCRLVFFWDTNRDCGAIPTSQDLLGEQFFVDLHQKFKDDIRPNIKSYLAKYHVAYVLKDKVLNPKYRPQMLGAELVYADERFELYHL